MNSQTMEYLYLTITPTLVMLHEQNFGKDKINHFAVWKCDLDGGLVEFCCQVRSRACRALLSSRCMCTCVSVGYQSVSGCACIPLS